jgi:ABC-type glutathione transport system ATPase component
MWHDIPDEPILRAERLRIARPPRRDGTRFVLDVPYLTIAPGSACFLCGPSGSGKSTLLRTLAGLERPDAGSVLFRHRFREIDLHRCSAAAWRATRKHLGVVYQDPREYLNDRRETLDIVADVLAVQGLDGDARASSVLDRLLGRQARRRRVRAQGLLARVGITPAQAARTPARLSGGQRQRVAIARALVADPEVLFLDEPTSALDVSVQAGLMNLLGELRAERRLSVVMVTHDLGLARQFADRVVVMDQGKVVEDGSAEQVLTAPRGRLTRELIEASRTSLPFTLVEEGKPCAGSP